MAKIDTLKVKFSNISGQIFNRLFEGDKTDNKKYVLTLY